MPGRRAGGQEQGGAAQGGGADAERAAGHGAVLARRGAAAGRAGAGAVGGSGPGLRVLSPAAPCPQAQRFLRAAGQAPDVAERYCGLYRRLRGATEELFGQQAAFLGALGRGFAGALLQLPFLTALHVSPAPGPRASFGVAASRAPRGRGAPRRAVPVPPQASERFARYLDGKIQELGGAAGSTGLLQQLLEPFVVFSGLEIAHTFEHFYR